ncbi:MAG: membrane protein insertion efficiency factor YidD [Schleiferiaceae bacterium]|nr:membrane protein insertion efficiency factor YidD [Schleiferiaceae bacterium]
MKPLLLQILGFPILALLWIYRNLISPLTPPSCRHIPTCSHYAQEAVKEWGPFQGGWLALRRLSKCHPWGTHGLDPVPKKEK